MIAALVLYGTPLAPAVAAVLAYRAFQLGLPALLGALAMLRLPGVLRGVSVVSEPAPAPDAMAVSAAGSSVRPLAVAT